LRNVALACMAIAGLVVADAARSEEGEGGELHRWVPSFGFSAGIIRQTASGFQQNSLRPTDDGVAPPGPFPGTPSSGDGSLVDPFVVFTSELMTPSLFSILGEPRLFVHGEVGGAFGSQQNVAKEGAPQAFVVPKFSNFAGSAVGGQGTATTLEIGTLISGGGLGVAFTAGVWGRRFRVKPSFELLRHQVEAEGMLQHVSGTDTGPKTFFSLHEQREEILYSAGGGLELEMDTLRAGPFVIALFANGQAYRLLSDPEIHLSFSDGTNTAVWETKLDRGIYRGSLGLRFRFLPEE